MDRRSAEDLPPGVHLQATLRRPDGELRQVRVLGDDQRGYLLVGIADLDEDGDGGDFWFRTMEQALARAERIGVRRDGWTEITDSSRVKMI